MKRAALAFALALSACAAPSSFDGLAGGAPATEAAKEDATVEAPRPVSPVSVSYVASSRPRLRWDLGPASKNLTGAIVEMSRTRDFAKDVKSFPATGSELVVPEDLALGVWFWRLKGAGAGTYGTATSPTWEMVVRGPAAHGSSDMPSRAMVDMNGDGEPDLLVGAIADDGNGPSGGSGAVPVGGSSANPAPSGTVPSSPLVLFYGGDPNRGFMGGPSDGWQGQPVATPYEGPLMIGGGTDLNGDGYTDLIESGVDSDFVDATKTKRWFGVNVVYSSKKADMAFDWDTAVPLYLGNTPSTVLPTVREGGDVDGDGYGDAVVGLPDVGFMVIGAASKPGGLPAMLPIYPSYAGGGAPSTVSRVAMGGFDANGDGLADVVFSLADTYEPSARAFAAAGSRDVRLGAPRLIDAPDARLATAFASGDFNGDGVDDLAITTPFSDSSRICIWWGSRDKLVTPGPCVSSPTGDKEFGASLTAADLEGDGVDELLATAKSGDTDGVRVIRVGANGAAGAAPIGVPGLGVRLTTIWPGRPGKARWAAVAADGSRIGVFEGDTLRDTMVPPQGILRGFGRGLR